MTPIHDVISKGQLVALNFGQAAVTATQTSVALKDLAGNNVGFAVPFDYDIIAVAWTLSAAGSAGAASVTPTINTTATSSGTASFGTAASGYVTVNRDVVRGKAGDVIGLNVTSNGTWNGTTSKLTATVFLIERLKGI